MKYEGFMVADAEAILDQYFLVSIGCGDVAGLLIQALFKIKKVEAQDVITSEDESGTYTIYFEKHSKDLIGIVVVDQGSPLKNFHYAIEVTDAHC